MEDTVALSLFYQQAAADIFAGSIDVGEHGSKLRMLKGQGEQREVQRPIVVHSPTHTLTHLLTHPLTHPTHPLTLSLLYSILS